MLLLSELYRQLRDVELFYEPMGTRELNERDHEIINSYISGALDYMYSRFPLKTQDLILSPLAGKTEYLISSKFAVSNTASPETKYIQDSPMKPFTDDWLLLLDCYDEMGRQIPVNNQNRLDGILTLAYNVIQIPMPLVDRQLELTYQAKHPKLTGEMDQELEISPALIPAIAQYIAYRRLAAKADERSIQQSINYYQQFQLSVEGLLASNMLNTDNRTTTDQFCMGGWV